MADDQVDYPAKNDWAFIQLSEAAQSARVTRAKGNGVSKSPGSSTIFGGIQGEATN